MSISYVLYTCTCTHRAQYTENSLANRNIPYRSTLQLDLRCKYSLCSPKTKWQKWFKFRLRGKIKSFYALRHIFSCSWGRKLSRFSKQSAAVVAWCLSAVASPDFCSSPRAPLSKGETQQWGSTEKRTELCPTPLLSWPLHPCLKQEPAVATSSQQEMSSLLPPPQTSLKCMPGCMLFTWSTFTLVSRAGKQKAPSFLLTLEPEPKLDWNVAGWILKCCFQRHDYVTYLCLL